MRPGLFFHSLNLRMTTAQDSEGIAETLFATRHIAEAVKYFDHALSCGADPLRHALERWESWMLLGEFEKAWQESDRFGAPFSFCGNRPERITVRCDRGIGDAIQFLRYVPALKKHCGLLRVEGPDRLLPLLEFLPCIDEAGELTYRGNPRSGGPEIECSDLPYLFRTTLNTIPASVPYIQIPAQRVKAARECFASSPCFKVGIAWAAGQWNPTRSIPLAALVPLAEVVGVKLFSLQRGADARQLRQLSNPGIILSAEREDSGIVDTAAAILNLDLVISVDTMIAHLAGALGKPVWTLLQHAADWRWMLETRISPWYPSMRLFRQSRLGSWESVVNQVHAELIREVSRARGIQQ